MSFLNSSTSKLASEVNGFLTYSDKLMELSPQQPPLGSGCSPPLTHWFSPTYVLRNCVLDYIITESVFKLGVCTNFNITLFIL